MVRGVGDTIDAFKSPWPPVPGSYTIGSMKSPVAIIVLGRGLFQLPSERYCILGSLRSSNLGIEKIIANVVSNPIIRFLIICGKEEGHLPRDALINLAENGVDERMNIIGSKAQLAFLPDVTQEAVARFRDQLKVIDLVYPKDTEGTIDWRDPTFDFDSPRLEELEETIKRCEKDNPGSYPSGPMLVSLPEPLITLPNIGSILEAQMLRITNVMMRMPSEALSIQCGEVIISSELQVFMDPLDGTIAQVPSLAFYARMKAYLTGQDR
jgi:tetrahydromethanopterin S-methyltransferase subunit A